MGRAVLAGLLLAASLLSAIDVDKLPEPTGYVSDIAGVVDSGSKAQLEEFCTRVERELGVQFALVTIDTLDDRPIRDVALAISRKWGVGSKKDNQGVLLLLAVKDRKSDIETGRGIEPYITDGFAGSTLRAMRPDLRAGDYGAALKSAASSMSAEIAQGKNIPFTGGFSGLEERQPRRERRRGNGDGFPWPLIVFGIFALLWLFGRGGGRRGGGRRGGGGFGSGFVTGMVLDSMLGGGRRGGGDWGGGGFGGGAGGGGGFGGFGGGDFGGGGASSDW